MHVCRRTDVDAYTPIRGLEPVAAVIRNPPLSRARAHRRIHHQLAQVCMSTSTVVETPMLSTAMENTMLHTVGSN